MLTGCATVPPLETGIPAYTISGKSYLPLVSLCDLKAINWDYDTFAKTVTLKKDSHEINLAVGSSIVLVDGLPQDLKSPVDIYKGAVVVPLRFKRDIIDIVFERAYPVGKAPSPRISTVRKIVIDPGHGGRDPGAIGITGLREKEICLDIARRLRAVLEPCGFDVFLTRDYDEFITLEERSDFANRGNADLFISIHANANRAKWISGLEAYYVSNNVDDSHRALVSAENSELRLENAPYGTQTLNLRTILWDIIYNQNRCESVELSRHICKYAANNLDIKVLGVKGAPFHVLKWTQMPSVLVEVGYVSNAYEERLLRKGFYRQQIAEAIAGGLNNYCQDYRLTVKSHR
jgi:N-acetylmuramoyl-L-alanine amidase